MHPSAAGLEASLLFLLVLSMHFSSSISSIFDGSRIERSSLPQVIFQVEENTELGQVIGSIYDKISLPLDQRFQFFLPQNPFFKFDSEGSLLVAGHLDRDNDPALCKEPNFPEICEWSSFLVDNKGNYISFRVRINDVNDNAPFWSVPFVTVTIPENSAPNFTTELLPARDPDYGVNTIKEYKLIGPSLNEDLFMLNINPFQSLTLRQRQTRDQQRLVKAPLTPVGTPVLVLLKPLDREQLQWINLTLLAVDGSPPYHTGVLEIQVQVSDKNDHSPLFAFQRYVAQLPEIAPVGSIIQLQPISISRQSDDNGIIGPLEDHFQAEDPDEGANGRVYYSFARSTPLETQMTFSIDSHSGQLRVARPLSYDDGPIAWNFQVVATDSGRPPRSSFTDVLIQLKDANNHPPSITVQSSMLHMLEGSQAEDSDMVIGRIRENVKVNKEHLATVTVNDRDTGLGGEFECFLRPEYANHFSLSLKGQIPQVLIYDLLVSGTFDHEAGKIRNVEIFCEDKGSPRLTSSHQVQILIEDENDNSPVFEFPFYRLTTKEGQPKGSIVGQIKASDADEGEAARLSYEIQWPKGTRPEGKVLTIDRTGNLTSKVILDRESAPYGYNLTVICRDNGDHRRNASANVHLALLDVNDCAMVFSQLTYNFTIVEDYSLDFQGERLVGNVQATDCDGPQFNRISYRLLNSYHLFNIDNDGRIFSIGILDREQEPVYELHVLATDRPTLNDNPAYTSETVHHHTATATVVVSVQDLNDNSPHFIHPANSSYPIRVSFQEDDGFVLTRMVAIDPDNGNNGTVSYRIVQGNQRGIFKLGEHSGDLYIGKKILAEQVGTHTLRVEARDHGTPPQISNNDIFIHVDASAPLGLQNDFLLGLGPNNGLFNGVVEGGSSLTISLLSTETMVIVYVIAGVVFVSLSILVAAIISCRRLRTRQKRQRRLWQRRQQQRWCQRGDSRSNGLIEVNANTGECFQKTLDGYRSLDNDKGDCDNIEAENLKTKEIGRNEVQHSLPESSCYTIRMTSTRHRPNLTSSVTTSTATPEAPPASFAYFLSTTTPTDVATTVTAASASGGSVAGDSIDLLFQPQSPVFPVEASIVGQPVSTLFNQLVECPVSQSNNHSATEFITLPISTEALIRTEIWANDPKSSEAYVTLKPYRQLDGCLHNVHFLETSASPVAEVSTMAPTTNASSSNCLLFHHHYSPERLADVYALTTDSTSPTPSMSILDPITGSRIYVPSFAANGGLIIPPQTATNSLTNTCALSPDSKIIAGERVELMRKLGSE